jgi:DNA-directed RNA polymerase specialized sigma24 family protein
MNKPLKTFVRALRESPRLFFGGSAAERDSVAWLQEVDWSDMVPRLLLYTAYRLRRMGRSPHELSPTGKTAEDYVLSAVEALFSGARRYDPERTSLFAFLCGVISSELSHEFQSQESRSLSRSISLDSEDAPDVAARDNLEQRAIIADSVEKFIRYLGDDPALQGYVRGRMQYPDATAEELATALRIGVDDMRNLDRRLRRRQLKWQSARAGRRVPQERVHAEPEVVALGSGEPEGLDAMVTALELPARDLDAELQRLGVDAETVSQLATTMASN